MHECTCPEPGQCPKFKKLMSPAMWRLCGDRCPDGCNPTKRAAFLEKWSSGRTCMPVLPPAPPPKDGPGTELKAILAALGLRPKECACNAKAARMNEWGVGGCQERKAEIVAWLREEQNKRGWVERLRATTVAIVSGLAFRVNPLDPIPSIVDEAIRRAAAKITE